MFFLDFLDWPGSGRMARNGQKRARQADCVKSLCARHPSDPLSWRPPAPRHQLLVVLSSGPGRPPTQVPVQVGGAVLPEGPRPAIGELRSQATRRRLGLQVLRHAQRERGRIDRQHRHDTGPLTPWRAATPPLPRPWSATTRDTPMDACRAWEPAGPTGAARSTKTLKTQEAAAQKLSRHAGPGTPWNRQRRARQADCVTSPRARRPSDPLSRRPPAPRRARVAITRPGCAPAARTRRPPGGRPSGYRPDSGRRGPIRRQPSASASDTSDHRPASDSR
ncbi:MAG: hypothetical protein RL223_2139 [Pseudomonadota bacterium]